jgi:CHAT domain-containing protein
VFSGDPEASYVVAADGPITLGRLGSVVAPRKYTEAPLELLVLSACATASGDEQAALGLAGVAVRAGARSALGSLWSIPDEAAYQVVTRFYSALDAPSTSKAKALRDAQLALLQGESRAFRHPYYWSAYLLISDWL